jgi:hypothetical protein
MLRVHRPDSRLRPGRVTIDDGVGMAVFQGNLPMRMAVRLRPFPSVVLVLVTLVKCVQMFVPQTPVARAQASPDR